MSFLHFSICSTLSLFSSAQRTPHFSSSKLFIADWHAISSFPFTASSSAFDFSQADTFSVFSSRAFSAACFSIPAMFSAAARADSSSTSAASAFAFSVLMSRKSACDCSCAFFTSSSCRFRVCASDFSIKSVSRWFSASADLRASTFCATDSRRVTMWDLYCPILAFSCSNLPTACCWTDLSKSSSSLFLPVRESARCTAAASWLRNSASDCSRERMRVLSASSIFFAPSFSCFTWSTSTASFPATAFFRSATCPRRLAMVSCSSSANFASFFASTLLAAASCSALALAVSSRFMCSIFSSSSLFSARTFSSSAIATRCPMYSFSTSASCARSFFVSRSASRARLCSTAVVFA
mmetsp:Transcript_18438/g.46049  ORF Transcript_18438/g.46049 Transcript_18438/m.46049 type:complete len:353 (+) Transcript_18438:489-1547(+)